MLTGTLKIEESNVEREQVKNGKWKVQSKDGMKSTQ